MQNDIQNIQNHLVSKKGISSPKGSNNDSALKDSLHSLSSDDADTKKSEISSSLDQLSKDVQISTTIASINGISDISNGTSNNNNNANASNDHSSSSSSNNNSIIYPNGDEYIGNLLNNYKHGHGTLKYASTGAIYIGEFKDDKRSGNGRTVTMDSAIYEGKYLDDKKHGYGVLTTPLFTYKGEFFNDEREGYGKLLLKDGDIYEGNFYFLFIIDSLIKCFNFNLIKRRMEKWFSTWRGYFCISYG